jgi:hypothetical protein
MAQEKKLLQDLNSNHSTRYVQAEALRMPKLGWGQRSPWADVSYVATLPKKIPSLKFFCFISPAS